MSVTLTKSVRPVDETVFPGTGWAMSVTLYLLIYVNLTMQGHVTVLLFDYHSGFDL